MNIVDVVNFNADASCLSSEKWLSILKGGKDSLFYKFLELYVEHEKPVVFSFPGATLSDIVSFNPEAISLINKHPYIFELLYRTYAHDISILRTDESFRFNLALGIRMTDKYLSNTCKYYLPSEFMLTGSQVKILGEHGLEGTFILSSRFKERYAKLIPSVPYEISGVVGSTLACMPFHPACTRGYLNSIHHFDGSYWNESIESAHKAHSPDIVYSWRDGESSFLIDHPIEREKAWLCQESEQITRLHMSQSTCQEQNIEPIHEVQRHYPRHPFAAWMEKLGLLGFILQIETIESQFDKLTTLQKSLFLQLIGSDILSSVEKNDVHIKITNFETRTLEECVIRRANKIIEGEDYLYLLENLSGGGKHELEKGTLKSAHMIKLDRRISLLSNYV